MCTEAARSLAVDMHVCELQLLLREMYELKVRKCKRKKGGEREWR